MQTPTVGRIVNFYPVDNPVARAAIVVDVHSDTCVSLQVFGRIGDVEVQQVTSVLREDQAGATPEARLAVPRWQWPQIKVHMPGASDG